MKAQSVLDTIGNTPSIRFSRLFPGEQQVWVKAERFNPGGSIKDRIALSMIEAAEKSGALQPGATIIEPTSGNTGVGLAMVAAVKGYKLILVMPESMSVERRRLMLAYGASFDLTPREKGMKGAIARAEELAAQTPGAWIPQQFDNAANPEVHARTTAQEILADFPEGLDVLITGVGTGGHITGVARVLKAEWPQLKVYAVEPTLSPVISGGQPGPHPIQGIGAGFIPTNLTPACWTVRCRSMVPLPCNSPAMPPRVKACWSASAPGPRWLPLPPSCPNCRPTRAYSASTTIPASATCRLKAFCRPDPHRH